MRPHFFNLHRGLPGVWGEDNNGIEWIKILSIFVMTTVFSCFFYINFIYSFLFGVMMTIFFSKYENIYVITHLG